MCPDFQKNYIQALKIKALIIMLGLLLQKALLNSKLKENSETLKRRFLLWANRQLDQLIFEGKKIKTDYKTMTEQLQTQTKRC